LDSGLVSDPNRSGAEKGPLPNFEKFNKTKEPPTETVGGSGLS